jgi:hypothetical protein
MTRTAGYSLLDHRGSENILEDINVDPIENKLALLSTVVPVTD